ncbi:dihydroorotate dehydrogenase (NAD+) catalytic subunit [Desulfitispora alkaliphila]|uniref:dihydroorotate dehydrogenase n=1 Tax=Desulfitispora alkaliphila TaxID=622674 RepID=UPI003D1E75D7
MVNMAVDFAGIKMKNPVTTASGTFGFGFEYAPVVDPTELGAVVVKGTTLKPRQGNPGVRLVETSGGMLNSIGLQNPGVDYFIDQILPTLKDKGVTVIVNISGSTTDEYAELAEKLSQTKAVSGLEINISCPNVKEGGIAFGTDPEQSYKVVSAVVKHSQIPVITKLSPNVTDIREIALSAKEAGTDGLSLINTVTGMAIDINSCDPKLGNKIGGLSGPAVKPIAVKAIWDVAQAVDLPIMGMGGIVHWSDAVEMMLAGATVVAVGTGNFINPKATLEVIEGIEKYCQDKGVASVSELIGLSWRRDK